MSVPSISTPGPSNLRVSSEKSKKMKVSRSPVKIPRRFEVASSAQSSQQHRVVEDFGLVPIWTASNPSENHTAMGETGEPLVFQSGLP